MPVRTDRCPHCWASLPESVEDHCLHCRRSLLPTGRRARRAAGEAARRGPETPRPQPDVAGPPAASPPAIAFEPVDTWRSVAVDLPASPSDLDAPAHESWAPAGESWAPPAEGPWAPSGPGTDAAPRPGSNSVWKFVAIGAAGFVVLAGLALIGVNVIGVRTNTPFAQTVDRLADEPVDYDGPTFSVRLPGRPAVDVVTKDGVEMTMYLVEVGDLATGVNVAELRPDVGFDLEAGVQGTAEGMGGTVASSSPIEVGGLPGRDYHIINAQGGDVTAWGRLIVTETKLYQITTAQEGDLVEPPAEHLTAIESFVIR